MSNSGRKGAQDAAAAQWVRSAARLRPEEKAPPPKLGSAGQPSPPSSETAEGSLRCHAVRKAPENEGLNATEVGV